MAERVPFSTVAVLTLISWAVGLGLFRARDGDHDAGHADPNEDGRAGQQPTLPHHWPPVAPAAAPKSRHFCIAALRMPHPTGQVGGRDSIRVDEGAHLGWGPESP